MNKKIGELLLLPLFLTLLFVPLWFAHAAAFSESSGQIVNAPAESTNVAIAATSQITLTEVISAAAGLDYVSDIGNAGDGRLFVIEKPGRIRIFNGTSLLATPFLDISSLISSNSGEQGLLGLAFHPDYATNGYFYVYYTHLKNGTTLISRLARYQVSGSDPNVANPASATMLLEIPQDAGNHNGGDLVFGPVDGYLYVSVGDGGVQGDPNNRAQTNTQLLGKILRLDVDGTGGADCDSSGNSNYAIPSGNPYANGSGGSCDEIWSNGLRNPWRIAKDPLTNDLWIADVGYASFEEVNFQPGSSIGEENWGWRCYEGFSSLNTSLCNAITNYTFPAYSYARGGSPFRCSIIGGLVYRGSAVPQLYGHYLFTDYCSAQFWSISGTNKDVLTSFNIPDTNGVPFARPTTFGEDVNGELYVGENNANASVFKITSASIPCDTCAKIRKITLSRGWNMISTNVNPETPDLETMLASIDNELVIMKNGDGQIYWPSQPINNIGNWDVLDGYQIYVNDPIILAITGPQVDPSQTPISLPSGWSLVSYLPDTPLALGTALNSINSKLVVAKDGNGLVYWPDLAIDQIVEMHSGQGYQLYLNTGGVLTYPNS